VPVYEYICDQCQHEFEELVLSDDDTIACPRCDSPHASKLLSKFAFKTSGGFRSTSARSSCAGCTPGPGGCSGCKP